MSISSDFLSVLYIVVNLISLGRMVRIMINGNWESWTELVTPGLHWTWLLKWSLY